MHVWVPQHKNSAYGVIKRIIAGLQGDIRFTVAVAKQLRHRFADAATNDEQVHTHTSDDVCIKSTAAC